jgi:hypothetical protein
MKLTTFLFSPAPGGAETPQRSSGGRGAAPSSAAGSPEPAAVEIPLDSKDLPIGQPVTLHLEDGPSIKGFKDPIYGWMDHNGVALPDTAKPKSWSAH